MAMDEKFLEATRLWTLVQPRVSAFVASMVRDFQDRDDVLQEVAMAVMTSFDTYDRTRPFIGWALGIARNHILRYQRRQGQEKHVFDSTAVEGLADAFTEAPAREEHLLDFLEGCLRALDSDSRLLYRLRYEQDMKPARIAASTGMAANTVAKALQRLRERLRACVERKAAIEGN